MLCMLLAQFTSNHSFAANKKTASVCEQNISTASAAEGVPVGLLYAVALTETGAGGQLRPYALNIEGESLSTNTKSAAIAAFQAARKNEKQLIDLGCMQINYFYHHAAFNTVDDMLDPRKNINYAAKFLKNLKQKHGSWTEAVAHYHASSKNKSAQHRYVCKVLSNMVAKNFGAWTPEAKAYCGAKPE